MLALYLIYSLTFLVSAGLAMIGISLAYQHYRDNHHSFMQILLYQQVFIFSFFLYAIWGNLILREIIRDITVDDEVVRRISFYFSVLGTPVLVVGWYMFLRFGYMVSGYRIAARYSLLYFTGLVIILLSFVITIRLGYIDIPTDPAKYIIRMLLWLNFAVHAIFFIPFFFPGKTNFLTITGINRRSVILFALVTLVYSVVFYFFDIAGYISTCISIVLLFAGQLYLPVIIRRNMTPEDLQTSGDGRINFEKFCSQFAISRRESEVILEICTGKSNKAISEKLFITLQTVKDHTSRIYSKTGVKNRVQLTNLVREKTGFPESVSS